MTFHAEVVADSICTATKCRVTTMLLRYPRIIHSEVMTHRMLARNAASSRAIPWPKMREAIEDNPFVPLVFGAAQKGMQMGDGVDDQEQCRKMWLSARWKAIDHASWLIDKGVHKSIANRLVEPWMWMTCLITATDWNNLWALRIHPAAEIHFQKIAGMAKAAIDASDPQRLKPGEWHLPFVTSDDRLDVSRSHPKSDVDWKVNTERKDAQVSSARCARLSYLTHDGVRDIAKDLELFSKLCPADGPPHASPMEHPCRAMATADRVGPFRGWRQFRKMLPNENVEG